VQAYYALQLLPALSGEAIAVTNADYVIFHYWSTKQVRRSRVVSL
jgi:hypothetical protein